MKMVSSIKRFFQAVADKTSGRASAEGSKSKNAKNKRPSKKREAQNRTKARMKK
jgi:hypothetical protein